MTWEEMYDILENFLHVDKNALDLAFSIGGCNKETAKKILFYYTGWWNFKDWIEAMIEETFKEIKKEDFS